MQDEHQKIAGSGSLDLAGTTIHSVLSTLLLSVFIKKARETSASSTMSAPYNSNASLTSSSNGGGSDNNNGGGDATCSSKSTHESSSTCNITMEMDLAEELNKLSMQDREKIMSDIHAIETQHSINQELQQLSSQQREDVLYDIHGISGPLEETEELITQSITLLKEHLSNRSNEVYRLALQHRNADYIQSREFLLMFLRADDFDTSKVADRLLQFLQQKLDLFGLEKLCQRISLQDLNEDDTQVLMRGYTQLLPHRDRAGRAVIVHMPAFKKFRGHENQVRSMYSFGKLFVCWLFYYSPRSWSWTRECCHHPYMCYNIF
jgi:hypothetical protein